MPITPDDARTIWAADVIPSPTRSPANPNWRPDSYLRELYLLQQSTKAEVTALGEAVKVLAQANGADPDAIASIVNQAVRDKLDRIRVEVTEEDE